MVKGHCDQDKHHSMKRKTYEINMSQMNYEKILQIFADDQTMR